jgi:chorismate mutase
MRQIRTETYEHTISGLLGKRAELMQEVAALREQMAVASNAVEILPAARG